MSEIINKKITGKHYFCLFMVALIVSAVKTSGIELPDSQPSEAFATGQAIGSGLGAMGMTWLLIFLVNSMSRLFRRKRVSESSLTSLWWVLSALIILAKLVSPSH